MPDPKIDGNLINITTTLLVACQEILALGTVTEATLPAAKTAGVRLNKAAEELRALNKAVEEVSKRGDELGKADTAAKAKTAIGKIKDVIDIEGQPSEQPNELKKLFDNVSTALVDAQKSLNKTSLDYATELDPRLPQTLYGIPSVKAEMRVGFNEIKGKGINLILFTSSTQKQRYSESTVSFEVVGSPPPPGPAAYGDYIVPVPGFLVVGAKRDELLNQLVEVKKITDTMIVEMKQLATVLLYQPLPEEKPKKEWSYYIVLWPGRQKNDSEDNWREWLLLNMAQDLEGKLHFIDDPNVASIFQDPQPDNGMIFLKQSTADSLVANFTPKQLAVLLIQFGDALMRSSMTMRFWLESVKYKLPKALEA